MKGYWIWTGELSGYNYCLTDSSEWSQIFEGEGREREKEARFFSVFRSTTNILRSWRKKAWLVSTRAQNKRNCSGHKAPVLASFPVVLAEKRSAFLLNKTKGITWNVTECSGDDLSHFLSRRFIFWGFHSRIWRGENSNDTKENENKCGVMWSGWGKRIGENLHIFPLALFFPLPQFQIFSFFFFGKRECSFDPQKH